MLKIDPSCRAREEYSANLNQQVNFFLKINIFISISQDTPHSSSINGNQTGSNININDEDNEDDTSDTLEDHQDILNEKVAENI